MGFDMHIRLTCDISQEQIDCGYDLTLIAIHSRFIEWLVGLGLPIISFSIHWETVEENEQHMFVTAELHQESPVQIDEQFFDEIHLGSDSDA
jgi:hypothetical protein